MRGKLGGGGGGCGGNGGGGGGGNIVNCGFRYRKLGEDLIKIINGGGSKPRLDVNLHQSHLQKYNHL